jgi:hypothetical protein
VTKRSRENGQRDKKVQPETIKKELMTFGQVWAFARARKWVEGSLDKSEVRLPNRIERPEAGAVLLPGSPQHVPSLDSLNLSSELRLVAFFRFQLQDTLLDINGGMVGGQLGDCRPKKGRTAATNHERRASLHLIAHANAQFPSRFER